MKVHDSPVTNNNSPVVLNGAPNGFHTNGHTFENKVRIRPYQNSDREMIGRLCCDTGFLGEPVDTLFKDRELFAELFTRAYLDHESEWAIVAEVDGKVVGYLLGSVCPKFNFTLMRTGFQTTSKMVLRFLTGNYAGHSRSRRFLQWLLTAGMREQPKHPRGAAHLHFQVEKNYRGRGVARQLWEVYERKLKAVGVKECYGAFFSYPGHRPEAAYTRYGFSVFDRRPTTLFQPEISEPVDVVCAHKIL